MLFGQDRDQLRGMYIKTWAAHRNNRPLEPLQVQIAAVIEQHPEYHPLLENADLAMGREYLPESGETNPFLHMGMHLAIREQVGTDRPAGIRALYQQSLMHTPDTHRLEHKLMDCLAEMIWQAQRDGVAPDEACYLACIKNLAEDG